MLWVMALVAAFFAGAFWQRSVCEVYEADIEEMQADMEAQSAEERRLLEKIKWMRHQLAVRDPVFDVPDSDADRAPSGSGMMGSGFAPPLTDRPWSAPSTKKGVQND
jgi:hypothetical protein